MKAHTSRDYLVLWKYPEALRVDGQMITGGVGKHFGERVSRLDR